MEYDYDAYCARFDLTSSRGVGDFLQSALTDWRNDELTDEQYDDLVARAVSALANGE